MTDTDRSAVYELCPPSAEWPDDAQWWAVDIIDQEASPSFWTTKPTVQYVVEDDREEAWVHLEPVHAASRTPSFKDGRFWKSAPTVTLPADIDWRDTLVSRAELERWEAEQANNASQPDAGHGWTDERLGERFGAYPFAGPAMREVRDDVERHCRRRLAELENDRKAAEILDRLRLKKEKELEQRIAELEAERDELKRAERLILKSLRVQFGNEDAVDQAAELWRVSRLVDDAEKMNSLHYWPSVHRVMLAGDAAHHMSVPIPDAIAHLEAQAGSQATPGGGGPEDERVTVDEADESLGVIEVYGIPKELSGAQATEWREARDTLYRYLETAKQQHGIKPQD